MAEDESEFLKLPVDERCVHKSWKARISGYEETKKLFVEWDEDDEKWKKYLGIIKKMVTDSNAVAQEKGLESVLLFAENCKLATKTASEVSEGLVLKCVAAPKSKTKEMATKILLMYVEIETHEKVIEALIEGLKQKNPKIPFGCIYNMTEILAAYGAKYIKVSPLLKAVIPLLDHKDKGVREEGKRLVIESYKWIGPMMKSQLTGVKPVQMTEFEAEFEKLEGAGQPKPTRWLRSVGPPRHVERGGGGAEEGGEEGEGDDEGDGVEEEALDPYEMMDPVEIISKIPKNFFEQIEEKKWQLRKESLDAVLPLAQSPKLQPGDYHELVKAVKKVIAKDTNVMLVALAAQILTGLTKGLRTAFKNHANNSLSTLLEKFKEKKLNVVTAVRECIDAMFPILGIEAIQEDILAALKHKTPTVKSETASYLARCFATCPPVLLTNKKVLKGYVSALLETLNSNDPAVREASAEALGALVKFIGESKIFQLMPDLDNLKQDKIKEKAEKIELSGKGAKKETSSKEPASKPSGPRVVKPGASKASSKPEASEHKSASKPASAPPKKAIKSGGAKKAAAGGGKSGGSAAQDNSQTIGLEPDISLEDAEERVEEVFSTDILSGLGDTNWKNRLASMETVVSTLNSAPEDMKTGLIVLKLLCSKKPGLKENNFQVLGLKLNAISLVAKKSKITQQGWDTLYPDIVDKLSDKKNLELAKSTLYDIADSSCFPVIFSSVLEGAFNQKNPTVKLESLNWASEGLKLFGMAGVQSRTALEMIKKGLSETNPGVRTAAIGLLGVLHWYLGAMARRMFEDEKPAVLSQIDAEIDKHAGQPTPAPTRGPKSREVGRGGGGGMDGGSGEEGEGEDGGESGGCIVEDLVPRNNIAPQLTPDLLDMIKDKNWKVRKEGLDKLKEIINTAKFITNDLGGLPGVLAPRTTDMNKILATQALELVGELVIGMGPQTRLQIPQLLPPVLAAFADSKNTVRAAARATLNTMVKETSLKDMFVNEIVSTAVGKGNPFVKQEIWGWLSEVLPEAKSLPKEELIACLVTLYADVEARSGDVRKPAQDCIFPIMKHTGFEPMRRATEKLSPVSKNTIVPLLEKARGELPAVAPPPQKAAKAAPPSKGKPTREASSDALKNGGKSGGANAGKMEKPAGKSRLGLTKPSAAKKGAEDVDSSPLYQANKLKNQRFKDEQKLKILKWNFSTPRAEFVDQLKEQITTANFNRSLFTMMFHADFKQHLKALDQLLEFAGSDVDALMANLDLILKWLTLRFFETNPSVNIKGLEYLIQVFTLLTEAEDGYVLHELEASAFIPYLVNKMGDPKDQMRNYCRTILRLICQLYSPAKLFPHLMTGLANKNAKLRTECMEEMGGHIKNSGLEVCGQKPGDTLKEIAKQISERDAGVRNAALNAITEAYFKEGDRLYKMMGNIPEKDMAMLEERIKRASKNRPKEPEPQAPPRKPSGHGKPGGLVRPGGAGLVRPGAPGSGQGRLGSVPPNGSGGPESMQDLRQRYQRSPPEGGRVGGGGRDRPVSGVFSLDLDKIEGDKERLSEGPKLIEHNLDDIMNSEPIALPVTRTGLQRMMSPEHNNHSRNGIQDDRQAVTTVIAQIINPDTQSCIRALAEIDVLLKDNTKADLFGPCIDHLVSMCTMQYKHVLDTKLRDPSSNENESLRTLQYLTMVLMTLYGHRDLVRRASTQVLHDLMNIIVLLLNDPVVNLIQGAQLIRAWNVLTVKIVDKSNHTNVTVALVKLLHECVGSTQLPEKYCTHIMKCLWKVIRGLPTWLPTMEPGPVLVALHQFLEKFPASYSKTMPDDTPIRTIKTVIHTLVQELGEDILLSIDRIPDPETSELVAYIRKLLANGVAKGKKGSGGEEPGSTNAAGGTTGSARKKSTARFSNSDHEALAAIFKKIGQKELSKIGLQELYKFKQDNPHADLEPFLAKSSSYFRDYIDRGLKNVEDDLARGSTGVQQSTHTSSVQYNSNTVTRTGSVLQDNNTQPTHLVFLERLKKLRAAGGLDTNGQENRDSNLQETYQEASYKEYSATGIQSYREGTTTASSGYSSGVSSAYTRHSSAIDRNQNPEHGVGPGNGNSADSGSSSGPADSGRSMPDVEAIKERLARIKNQAAY